MKKILLSVALTATYPACLAQQVDLVCTGWKPFYQNLAGSPVNPDTKTDTLVIHLNMKLRTASYSTQVGEIVTSFRESSGYYSGTTHIEQQQLGKYVTKINLSMERMTGSTYIIYEFPGDEGSKILFSGKCVPGKPLF